MVDGSLLSLAHALATLPQIWCMSCPGLWFLQVLRYISVSLIAAIFTGAKGTIFRSVLSSAEVFQGSSSSAPHSRVPSVPAGQVGSGGGAGTWF